MRSFTRIFLMEPEVFIVKTSQKDRTKNNGLIPNLDEILITPPAADDSYAQFSKEKEEAFDRWVLMRRTQHLLMQRKLN